MAGIKDSYLSVMVVGTIFPRTNGLCFILAGRQIMLLGCFRLRFNYGAALNNEQSWWMRSVRNRVRLNSRRGIDSHSLGKTFRCPQEKAML
jgi:hypothetical protein